MSSPPYQCTAGAGMSSKMASNSRRMHDAPSLSFPPPPLAISAAASASSVSHPPRALPNSVRYSI